ncbi:hypothetical protein fugu_004626 [Takifugu bimaculatus]|uniref:Bactericidal permeability-increasing protein n=1 Tax=Takifugu bimaculatus TaxID=433685 RepID=A0A4Z2B822_9TELE|nr:hypothetical protein fugu_004626 [Takifugu bimaculatus]
MEGCPGPTAAWHGGTENPSVWGTLHLLCSAHSTIDMRLPFVLSTKTIQVSPDRSRSPQTQYLTAAHVQMCREQKSLRRTQQPVRTCVETQVSCNSCSVLGNPSLMSLPGSPTILRDAWCLHHSFYSALLCSAEKQNRPFRVNYCQHLLQTVIMFLCGWLVMVTLIPVILSVNPGVEVKITDKGIEYGRQLGIAAIQEKLKKIQIPDFSGKQRVSPIGKVQYSLTNIQIVNIGLPIAPIQLVPGSGVKLSINNAFINLRGNWRVKFLRWVKNSGSFEVGVNDLSISESLAVKSDSTGRPEVSTISCAASVGRVRIKFHGGASWLYNLFSKYIEKALKSALQKQICPLVTNAIDDMNPRLKTLNVLANVDKYAEIEYSMVSSPAISSSSIALKLKGQFYNIGQHQEPPFSAPAFSLPPENSNMLYMALSAFTANSAAFVYHKAGVLSIYITDDMIPKRSPIRLTTTTFGTFIPQVNNNATHSVRAATFNVDRPTKSLCFQISKQFPGLMMKLLMKTDKSPVVTFEPDRVTVQVTGTVTAYAIQPNDTLTPLFILNLDTSVSSKVSLSGMKLGVSLTLNKMKLSLQTSYVGQFQVQTLSNSLEFVLKWVVIPVVNVQLGKGYPLPALKNMELENTKLQILKDYMLIGTDVKFTG